MCFPCGSDGKESDRNAGDPGSIPELGRSLEEGKATHCSILAWRIPWTSPWVAKSRTRLSDFHYGLLSDSSTRFLLCEVNAKLPQLFIQLLLGGGLRPKALKWIFIHAPADVFRNQCSKFHIFTSWQVLTLFAWANQRKTHQRGKICRILYYSNSAYFSA